ncbi:MAG: cupin domain-containing protein [Rikenellaceae bacterium]|nr:cupin domain-containing protein [Rikenellaceae bacterium]
MENTKNPFIKLSKVETVETAPGVQRRILGYGEELMTVSVIFAAGSDGGGLHSHPHVQSSVITSGKFEVTVGGKKEILSAGDGFYVESGVKHGVKCLENGEIIDNFNPVRKDFL